MMRGCYASGGVHIVVQCYVDDPTAKDVTMFNYNFNQCLVRTAQVSNTLGSTVTTCNTSKFSSNAVSAKRARNWMI